MSKLDKPTIPMLALLAKLGKYAKRRKYTLTLALALSFATTGIVLYLPRIIKTIVDDALIKNNNDLLWQLTTLYLGLEVIRMIGQFAHTYLFQIVGQNVLQDIRTDLYQHIIRMPIAFFNRNPTGKLVTRLTNDTANLADLFSYEFLRIITDALIVVGVLGAMLWLNLELGLILLAVFPLIILIIRFFSTKLRTTFRASREKLSELNAFFAERISGMPTIQMMGRESYESKRFDYLSHQYFAKQSASVRIFAFMMPSITLLSAISIALVIYYGGIITVRQEIALGTLVAFFYYVQLMYTPVRSMTEKFQMFQKCMASADKIFALLEENQETNLSRHEPKSEPIQGSIEFQNVSFTYENVSNPKKWALKDTSFSIKAGETIALVGHTGAGKTTLASLIFRFYDNQIGTILIDGKNIRSFDKRNLRKNLGYVQQDVFIFSGSLLDNIRLLKPEASDSQVANAIQRTGLDRIVNRLPDGLHTNLDERGANLSQGERQVLAFTRVLLQEPKILILDEATASMDADSEYKIQQATKEAVRDRTAIIIAHRLSTIREADRIFCFSHGELIEHGAHEELMQAEGMYHQFVSLQSGDNSLPTSNHSSQPKLH